MGTLEILVRTHFTLVAAEKGTQLKDVICYGSGFMMAYKGYKFIVTAAHVNEPTWTKQAKVKEIRDNDVAIVTHLAQIKDGVMQTMYIPIGGFTYINSFKVDPSTTDFLSVFNEVEKNPIPVDVAVAMVDERPGVFSFKEWATPEESNNNWEAMSKIIMPSETIIAPDVNDHFFVYGRIKFEPKIDDKGQPYMYSEPRFHCDMEYYTTIQDNIHVFKATENIVYEEWAGISGSPVLNPNGYVVGIASAVSVGTPFLFALDIKQVLPLFDVLILEKQNGKK